MNNEIQGTVIVQFIVDKEGNVSDVQAISGPDQGAASGKRRYGLSRRVVAVTRLFRMVVR